MEKTGKIILTILALLIVGAILWLFLADNDQQNQTYNGNDQKNQQEDGDQQNENKDQNWSTYNNSELGFSFQHPNEYGNVDATVSESVDQGEKISGTFINLNDLQFGGTTRNFQEGREGTFTDVQGFMEENGTYYALYPLDRRYEISVEEIITSEDGTRVVVFNGQEPESNTIPATPLHFGENNFGAVFNLDTVGDDQFGGIGFMNSAPNRISLEEFKEMLRTITLE